MHESAPLLLSECYFALSEAYKHGRLGVGHRTEPTKIAALTCVTIAVVCPLRPPNPDNVERVEEIYANPMLAMTAACSIVGHLFHQRAFDDRRRFYKALMRIEMPSLDPIIQEFVSRDGALNSDWKIDLSRSESGTLDSKVCMFSVLRDVKIFR